jgi:heterodisulfide reductase subunit C
MSCFKCRERCPQKVAPVEILFALKNLAVASGKQIPGNYAALLQSVLSIGLLQEVKSVTTRDNKTKSRPDLGLPEISKPTDQTKFQTMLSKIAIEKV